MMQIDSNVMSKGKVLNCPNCHAKDQYFKLTTTTGTLRPGRRVSLSEELFICEECGYLTRNLNEVRVNENHE